MLRAGIKYNSFLTTMFLGIGMTYAFQIQLKQLKKRSRS
jgi:hypothetical protein